MTRRSDSGRPRANVSGPSAPHTRFAQVEEETHKVRKENVSRRDLQELRHPQFEPRYYTPSHLKWAILPGGGRKGRSSGRGQFTPRIKEKKNIQTSAQWVEVIQCENGSRFQAIKANMCGQVYILAVIVVVIKQSWQTHCRASWCRDFVLLPISPAEPPAVPTWGCLHLDPWGS